MENQPQGKQQAIRRKSKTKKRSNKPRYEDKSWQIPPYGQNINDRRDGLKDESCGSGS